jgi:hypothetical protein
MEAQGSSPGGGHRHSFALLYFARPSKHDGISGDGDSCQIYSARKLALSIIRVTIILNGRLDPRNMGFYQRKRS